jgi:hypothetical protein
MDIINSTGRTLQDYLIKLAPDFSVFTMLEGYYYGHESEFVNNEKDLFYFNKFSGDVVFSSFSSTFYRAMFLVYTDGDVSVDGLNQDEYTVFPHHNGSKIVIVWKDSAITISSDEPIDLAMGVAF